MRQITITSRSESPAKLTKREQLILLEIGSDMIDSASAFVSYLSEAYGFSKSSVWYNLNRLKELLTLDFATKEEPGKALALTKRGKQELRELEHSGVKLEDFEVYQPLVDKAGLDKKSKGQSVPLHNPFIIGTGAFGR